MHSKHKLLYLKLKYLQKQLQSVEWILLVDGGMSTFDLELDYLVSEQTAKEMTKVDLNSKSFHRKFDGVLKRVDFNFRPNNNPKSKRGEKINDKNIEAAFDMIGYGKIEDFIDKEDVEECGSNYGSDSETESDSDTNSSHSSDSSDSSDSEEEKPVDRHPFK